MRNILIQLDTDALPSTFDRVVAVDAGVDELFSYGGVTPENVTGLVHGAMFTRGPKDLCHTALYIGGSRVEAGEALLKAVTATFFGPIRVSVMIDSNGSNTTAAAAVLAARKHVPLSGATAVILGGTGPVGHRAAQILAAKGAMVRVVSRAKDRAEQTCAAIRGVVPDARLEAIGADGPQQSLQAAQGASILIAAGAAGIQFLNEGEWSSLPQLQVMIDVNAVPPLGLGGVQVVDKGVERQGVICYGALGVGGTKMKIHKASLVKLFETNDKILDTAAIYAIGETLG